MAAKYVKLYELKRGEKFYDWEGIIHVMLYCVYDPANPDYIEYDARIFKTNEIVNHRLCGKCVSEQPYIKYTGRDRSSFMAGFKRAVELCKSELTKNQQSILKIEHDVTIHLTAGYSYQRWMRNEK